MIWWSFRQTFLSAALGCSDVLICNCLTAGHPDHHASFALGALSDGTVIAEASWEHTTRCTRVDGCLNLLEVLIRVQVVAVFINVFNALQILLRDSGQPVTMHEMSYSFDCSPPVTMLCSPEWTRHDVVDDVSLHV